MGPSRVRLAPMMVRLNVIGSCSVTLVDDKGESAFTTSARLLFHLAVAPPEGLYRSELGQALWPLDEPAACQNRLRVALSKLRSKAPNLLQESRNRLSLNPEIVSVDLWMVKDEAVSVEDEVAPHPEVEGWLRMKDILSCSLAPGLESGALEAARTEWSDWAGTRLKRGAELALRLGKYESARELAWAGLLHLSVDKELWQFLLASCRALGDLQPARRLYARLKTEARQAGRDFELETSGLAKDLRDAKSLAEPESSLEGSRFSDAILREGLQRRPDLVLPLLSAPQLLPLVGGNPRLAADLLEEAVAGSPKDLPEWPRCAGRLIGLWAWLDESQKVQDLAPEVLNSTDDPTIRRAVYNALAASLAIKRRWKEADEALDWTKHLAEEAGSHLDAVNVEGNRACFWWMQGRFDEADHLYDEVLEELQTIEEARARFDTAVAMGNRAFIPIMQGDLEEGRRRLEEAAQWRSDHGIILPDGLEGPCLCMARIRDGELAGSARQMRRALMSLFEGRSPRFQLAGLEYASLSLIWVGRSDSAVLAIDKIAEWRRGCGFERCEAEVRMIATILADAFAARSPGDSEPPELSSPEELGAWIVRSIRRAEVAGRPR